MRVFLGVTEVAGVQAGLARGLRALGHQVTEFTFEPHPFGYATAGAGDPGFMLRLGQRMHVRRRAATSMRAHALMAGEVAARLAALPGLARRHDAFIFLFGTSVLSPWEGVALRAAGRPVVHVLLGSDARSPLIDGYHIGADGQFDEDALLAQAQRAAKRLRAISRASTSVLALPEYSHLLSVPFVDLLRIGLPVGGANRPHSALDDAAPVRTGPVRLLHAPSHQRAKGTALIRAAVAQLLEEGANVTFRELSGVPNREVRFALAETDLVLDQLYSDTPLPGLAAEAAWEGVPSLIGSVHGRGLNEDRDLSDVPPSFLCQPEEFVSTLRALVAQPELLRERGRAARLFVSQRWSDIGVAQRVVELIERPESVPTLQPRRDGFGGCGLSLADSRSVAQRIVAAGLAERTWPREAAAAYARFAAADVVTGELQSIGAPS